MLRTLYLCSCASGGPVYKKLFLYFLSCCGYLLESYRIIIEIWACRKKVHIYNTVEVGIYKPQLNEFPIIFLHYR